MRRRTAGRRERAEAIVAALGGAANIVAVEPCTTRLRSEVRDGARVDEPGLRAAGAIAVLRSGGVVQVVVGPEADALAADIEDVLE
ncbi:PTS transporter subunit EIIB [Actinomadura rayongensis]|uniref:PTS transporter subunit EIIB n=1 Tax=Actinomadura rayongensis TaxID=1429076 RepID=A0A6I4W923_9ACTN|nr:PTS transporter subunit EIIB [Actinomadura rayongensis]MXQ64596.1 PTS transporter subunit EIIB [Actinomadura rayongensis]